MIGLRCTLLLGLLRQRCGLNGGGVLALSEVTIPLYTDLGCAELNCLMSLSRETTARLVLVLLFWMNSEELSSLTACAAVQMVKKLVTAGASIAATTGDGSTPLIIAASHGHVQVCVQLSGFRHC